MKIIIEKDSDAVGETAALIIAKRVNQHPNLVLGLATGETPKTTYQHLIKLNQSNYVNFKEVTTFNLDEYVGLEQDNPNSYHYYMHHNFFNHIDINNDNIHLLNGSAKDLSKEAQKYDALIQEHNHIDLQLLGIGLNGHIGFNEPNQSLRLDTHVTDLDIVTIKQNSPFFNDGKTPSKAITMGLGHIARAKEILLLATGVRKANIMANLLNSNTLSTNTPASTLLLHQNVTVIMDEDAASLYLKKT